METEKPGLSTTMTQEIWVIPFFGQGHILPSIELCKHLASRNFKATLVVPSHLSSTIPSYLHQYPLLEIAELPSSPPPPPPPPPPQQPGQDPLFHQRKHHAQLGQDIEDLIKTRSQQPGSTLPNCAVVDVMMGWTLESLEKFGVPTIGFFTSGACSAAMEYAMWKARLQEFKPGEIRLLPGLPEEMALVDSDLKTRPHGPQGGGGGPPPTGRPPGVGFLMPPSGMGPPELGSQPRWLEDVKGSIAYMINTCDEVEYPFVKYLSHQIQKPVWGVGPLLPEQYWKSAGSLLHDREIRTNRRSNVTEEEVITWLNSKQLGSVLYVSFGSEVGPTMEEYPQLADALEASNRPFVWVIQPGSGRSAPPGQLGSESDEGYYPRGLEKRVGQRGLIIRGWAPQLLILSHPSLGGFLSHCGWNSTMEAIVRGVPFLAWPIRGDQYHNAKLVVKHLKVGTMISDDLSQLVKKDDIIQGIQRLWGDEDFKRRAALLSAKFGQDGFPASSVHSLNAFRNFINQKTT